MAPRSAFRASSIATVTSKHVGQRAGRLRLGALAVPFAAPLRPPHWHGPRFAIELCA